MINLVQRMYKARDITNYKTAKTALDLLTSKNDTNKFKTAFTTIIKLTTKKQIKLNLKQILNNRNTALEKEIVNKVEQVVNKPDIQIKHEESEMPSYEMILKHEHVEFYNVCNERKQKHYIDTPPSIWNIYRNHY